MDGIGQGFVNLLREEVTFTPLCIKFCLDNSVTCIPIEKSKCHVTVNSTRFLAKRQLGKNEILCINNILLFLPLNSVIT